MTNEKTNPSLPGEKFVPTFTWRCRACLKEWRWPIDQVPHNQADLDSCLACRLRDGDVEEFTCQECRWEKNGVQE